MRRADPAVERTRQRSGQLNEDALVEAIARLAERPRERRILLGIGDDAAVWQPSRSHRSVITTDALAEDVHFRRGESLESVGRRAMVANLSDIAAMGARPVLATIALALPVESATEDALALTRGMTREAQAYGCAIAGGDLTRAASITIAITVIGEVRPSNLKTRAGARPGDVIAVTGALGAAAREGYDRVPVPRLAEGRWLGGSKHVHAMMDLSDGLSTDLARMCERSKCGALVERVPAAQGASEESALNAGEDFELLAAVDRRAFKHLALRFKKRFGRELERAGIFRESPGVFARRNDREEPLPRGGWGHFS